jgi:enoyl-CoA hydratase
LINAAVPAEQLDKTVADFAERLSKGASKAVQWTKLSVNIGLKQLTQSVIDASFAYEALSNRTKDHQEAVNAFREKRTANFTGE